jgi:hypothetical protein
MYTLATASGKERENPGRARGLGFVWPQRGWVSFGLKTQGLLKNSLTESPKQSTIRPMSDKELGKLWADTNYMETGYSGLVVCLIRKLVEERKILLLTRHAGGAMWTAKEEVAAEKLALCDFGIDPKTWE